MYNYALDAIEVETLWESYINEPWIEGQPDGVVTGVGQDVRYTVDARNPYTNDPCGLRYKWYKYVYGDDDILMDTIVENGNWTLKDVKLSDSGWVGGI